MKTMLTLWESVLAEKGEEMTASDATTWRNLQYGYPDSKKRPGMVMLVR